MYKVERDDEARYEVGYADGERDGSEISQINWYLSSMACSFASCGFGGCYMWSDAKHSGDTPRKVPIGQDPSYTIGYVEGYRDATKSSKSTAALIGCVIGVTLEVIVVGVVLGDYLKTFKDLFD